MRELHDAAPAPAADPGAEQKLNPKPRRLRVRWYRDGEVIRGFRDSNYTLQRADVGHRVSVQLTYERRHFQRQAVRSARTSPVRP